MKRVDFSYTGGFPFDQRTLDDMQDGYMDVLVALLRFLKVPATGSHIIYGCAVNGANIDPGMMYIDGDLCSFAGFAGNATTKIGKLVTTTTAPFQNGNNNPVYIETTAVLDAAGIELGQFTNYSNALVYDANYVHTDNNFTAALLAKLNGIANGAEVNVKANWNEANPASDAYIQNKPVLENVLYVGSQILGNWPGLYSQTIDVNFPDVGTTNYYVDLQVKSNNPLGSRGADLLAWTTADYTATGFELSAKSVSPGTNNIEIFYKIIAL